VPISIAKLAMPDNAIANFLNHSFGVIVNDRDGILRRGHPELDRIYRINRISAKTKSRNLVNPV